MTVTDKDLHELRTYAESIKGATDALLRIIKLPEDHEIIGLLRVPRNPSREIIRIIDRVEGESNPTDTGG